MHDRGRERRQRPATCVSLHTCSIYVFTYLEHGEAGRAKVGKVHGGFCAKVMGAKDGVDGSDDEQDDKRVAHRQDRTAKRAHQLVQILQPREEAHLGARRRGQVWSGSGQRGKGSVGWGGGGRQKTL
jgi:hypothetical protein